MKERISIFNYEAFYLDYLEGNLDENDSRLLLEFLSEHPECEIEIDELPTLEANAANQNWDELKIVGSEDRITEQNVEHFIISSVEGIISDEKNEELMLFVEKHPTYKKLIDSHKKLILQPDLRVVFENKNELKQRSTVIMWPFYVAAVAAVIFVLLYLNIPSSTVTAPAAVPTQKAKISKPNNDVLANPELDIDSINLLANVEYSSTSKYTAAKKDTTSKIDNNTVITPRAVRNVLSSDYSRKLEPLAVVFQNENPTENEDVLAMNDVNTLINPIEPITTFISRKTNVDIEYKQRKKTSEKKGGFFLKIGKFELSRNVH